MKVEGIENIYPYLQSDGSIRLFTYHSDDVEFYGICLLDNGDGIKINFEVDVDMPESVNKTVLKKFNAQIESVRAKAQLEVESIEKAKQKFLALEVTA